MLEIMSSQINFKEYVLSHPNIVVVYGAGTASKIAFPYIPQIDYYCDKNADKIISFNGKKVLHPKELESISSELIILVCINKKQSSFDEICNSLKQYKIKAKVFNYFNNIAFPCYIPKIKYQANTRKHSLKVRLVSYNPEWILGKFARKLNENLLSLGIQSDIGTCIDSSADINHHIAYHWYEPVQAANDTIMITHVDSINKVEQLRFQLQTALMGICMSKETMNFLVSFGLPREKLCYITPAHDGIIAPKKFVLGITHKNYSDIDHRKQVNILLTICKHIDPMYFSFIIMGTGWENIVLQIKNMGFDITYYDHFDYELYNKIIPCLDYYLFFGYDEGSMGYLDALAAGVETLVTPQGFHMDIPAGITYPCEVAADFIHALNMIKEERKKRVQSVADLTWMNYTKKHIEVWKYIIQGDSLDNLLMNKHKYNDGIFSALLRDI